MVKPLTFKGDKRPKKRKRVEADDATNKNHNGDESGAGAATTSKQLRNKHASDEEEEANDDSWVSADTTADVVGPVMIVLPTDVPCALACDAAGKVFTLPIENIVDANPVTAEPHDVRQVWVANPIAGTEHYRFRGHHGRYLACDKNGQLYATSEAISALESFNVIATADTPGTFQLQTLRDTFLTIKPSTSSSVSAAAQRPEVRGDAEAITFNTTLRIRMQARYKPKLKASKEEKALAKISRRDLEEAVGRRLDEDEVRILKRARKEGDYHERLMDLRVKNKHDKYS